MKRKPDMSIADYGAVLAQAHSAVQRGASAHIAMR